MFATGSGNRFQYQVESYGRLTKRVLDAALLKTQHYKVRIKVEVEQSKLNLGVVTIEKGAFCLLSTKVANL